MEQNTEKEIKSMIFIGNGFDIAHGYKTRYGDFYENSNELRKYASKGNLLCQHILDNVKGDMWKDLECGLFEYSKKLSIEKGEGDSISAERFRSEFFELKTALFYYLENEQNNRSVNNNPGRKVELLYNEWSKMDFQIVSFNYTFMVANYTVSPKSYKGGLDFDFGKLIYQHGSIKNINSYGNNTVDSIVLGIDENQKVEKAHSFLYKSHQKLFSISSLRNYINEKDVYIIYGCSMGPTDDFYFRSLFKGKKNKLFIIYGYGENALNDIMENVNAYTNGLNSYQADNNNEIVSIDSSLNNAVSKTKETLDRLGSRKAKTSRA